MVWETDFFILASGTVVICTLWPVFNGQKILLISNNQIELLQSVWNIGFFQWLFWFGSQISSALDKNIDFHCIKNSYWLRFPDFMNIIFFLVKKK